jgi:hypothetical protein
MLKVVFCLQLHIVRNFQIIGVMTSGPGFSYLVDQYDTASRRATLSNKDTSAWAVSVGRQKRVPLDWLLGNFSAQFEVTNFIVQYPLRELIIIRLVKKCPTIFFFLWRYSPNLGLGLAPWNSPFHFGFLDLRHSVGLLGRVISSSQGLYLYINTEKRTHTNTKHPCPGWDSNRRSRLPRERRQCMPYTVTGNVLPYTAQIWSVHAQKSVIRHIPYLSACFRKIQYNSSLLYMSNFSRYYNTRWSFNGKSHHLLYNISYY